MTWHLAEYTVLLDERKDTENSVSGGYETSTAARAGLYLTRLKLRASRTAPHFGERTAERGCRDRRD